MCREKVWGGVPRGLASDWGGGQDPETEQMVLVPLCSKGPEGRGLYLLITFKAL